MKILNGKRWAGFDQKSSLQSSQMYDVFIVFLIISLCSFYLMEIAGYIERRISAYMISPFKELLQKMKRFYKYILRALEQINDKYISFHLSTSNFMMKTISFWRIIKDYLMFVVTFVLCNHASFCKYMYIHTSKCAFGNMHS